MKKLLSVILAIVISVLCIVPVFAETEAETITEIRTADDLNNIRNNLSGKYILMNDIDLSSYENWEPIGTSETPFAGELDGNGFQLKNLTEKYNPAENVVCYYGLFGYISNAIIKNVALVGCNLQITNHGETRGKCRIGSIAGYSNSSAISDCTVSGKVSAEGFDEAVVGGIIGRTKLAEISRCSNYADITIVNYKYAEDIFIGGVIGDLANSSVISESSNHGNVSVVGEWENEYCYMEIGGVCGNCDDKWVMTNSVINCYNSGKVSTIFTSDRTRIGGVCGESYETQCVYNVGEIVVPEGFEGLAGAISGNIFHSSLAIGMPHYMTNAYYINADMIPSYDWESLPESFDEQPFINVKLLTEEEFKNQESFVGFDFETVWEMEENGYPVLQNQPEPPVTEPAPDPDTVTEIRTADDLNNIRNNLSGKYILMNDIDLSSYENWEPIGTSETPFAGELDGNGYSISNMTIKGEYTDGDTLRFGLFTELNYSTVTDLNILNVDIDLKFIGNVSESFRVGALAGYAGNSALENCIVSGNINLEGFEKGNAGGFFGLGSSCMPTDCVNYADINFSSEDISKVSIGGIAGKALMISECCNYGNITVSSVDSDDSDASVYVGGIVGEPHQFGNMINNCYNRGTIELDFSTPSTYVGGLAGESIVFCNSYNSGEIILPENFKGFVGGLSGNNLSWVSVPVEPGYKTENAYYINEGFYSSYSDGAAPADDEFENVKLLTEEEFKKQESFVGFDFETVWAMEENGYPVLQNQPVLPEIEPAPDPEPTPDPDPDPTPDPEPTPEPVNNVKSAEIVYVPLKNRIVFGFGSPNHPDGIVLKLTYNDGTEKTETIVRKDNGYYAGNEQVFGVVHTEEVRYGCQTETLCVNEERVSADYNYFVIPPIFYMIISFLQGELFVIA